MQSHFPAVKLLIEGKKIESSSAEQTAHSWDVFGLVPLKQNELFR